MLRRTFEATALVASVTRNRTLLFVAGLVGLLVIAWLAGMREHHQPLPAPSASSQQRAPAMPMQSIVSSTGPDQLFAELASEPKWQELVKGGAPFSFRYSHRPFGEVTLDAARIKERDAGVYEVHADAFSLGSQTWRDLDLSLRRRVETIELVQAPSGDFKPIQVSYTKGRAAALWAITLPHQPARRALDHYAPDLALGDERAALLVSVSLVVPHVPENPVRGQLELVLDAWPKPDWPDAKALLGDTLSLGGRIEPDASGANWQLEDVRVSTLLFSLNGRGHIEWRRTPALRLAAAGTLTCQQLASNLAPSVYQEQVQRYLASASRAQRAGTVELSLHLDIDAAAGRREVLFRLGSGCGLEAH